MKGLQVLDLRQVNIGIVGMGFLADALKINNVSIELEN
jgi:hypothetical protein